MPRVSFKKAANKEELFAKYTALRDQQEQPSAAIKVEPIDLEAAEEPPQKPMAEIIREADSPGIPGGGGPAGEIRKQELKDAAALQMADAVRAMREQSKKAKPMYTEEQVFALKAHLTQQFVDMEIKHLAIAAGAGVVIGLGLYYLLFSKPAVEMVVETAAENA